MKKAIGYLRVSTKKQGRTGYGLAAQKKAITDFAVQNGYIILKYFTEVDSGKNNKRPLLQKAMALCKKEDSVLLVAKICRLSRKVPFVARLIESQFRFIVTEMPFANKFMLYMMAAYAEQEGDFISERTVLGLESASRKGVRFGIGVRKTHDKQRKAYKSFVRKMKPVVDGLRNKGKTSITAIRDALNGRKIKTFRGGASRWHLSTVHRLLKEIYKNRKH